jgi:hypothetical protein
MLYSIQVHTLKCEYEQHQFTNEEVSYYLYTLQELEL